MKILILITLSMSFSAYSSFFQTVCENADKSIKYSNGQAINQIEMHLKDEGTKIIKYADYRVVTLEKINISKVCQKNMWISTYVSQLVFSSYNQSLDAKNGLFLCVSRWNDRGVKCP